VTPGNGLPSSSLTVPEMALRFAPDGARARAIAGNTRRIEEILLMNESKRHLPFEPRGEAFGKLLERSGRGRRSGGSLAF
jgi:hypothetical protein